MNNMIAAAKTLPSIPTLILVTGLSTLSLNLFIPSLSNIAETFRADYSVTSFSIAGYLGMTALLQIFTGPVWPKTGSAIGNSDLRFGLNRLRGWQRTSGRSWFSA